MNNHTQPKQIIDSRGRHTTVHVNPDKGVSSGAGRAASLPAVTGSVATTAGRKVDYTFELETISPMDGSAYDFRDIDNHLDNIVQHLERELGSAGFGDDADFVFDESDESYGDFQEFKVEIEEWANGLRQITGVKVEVPPATDNAQDWINYGSKIGNQWSELVDGNHGNALIRADEAARKIIKDYKASDEYRSVPGYIKRNIDWDGVAKDYLTGAKVRIHGDDYYFTEINYL